MTLAADLVARLRAIDEKARAELAGPLAELEALPDHSATVAALEAEVARLQAELAACKEPSGVWTPARLDDLTPRPVGPDDVLWTDLYASGDDLRKVLAKVPAGKILRTPDGVYEFSDFSMTNFSGLRFGTAGTPGRGIEGLDRGTVIRPKVKSSTKAGVSGANNLSTSSGTNQTKQLCFQSVVDPVLAMLTLEGTDQGHFYHGAQFYKCSGTPDTRGLRLVGASPGFGNSPPGETFGLDILNSHGMTFTDFEVDGQGRSASPVGFNQSNDGRLVRAWLHDAVAGMPTMWQGVGFTSEDLWCRRNGTGSGAKSGHGLNHERVTGKVEHVRLNVAHEGTYSTVDGHTTNTSAAHVTLLNDRADMPDVTIIDPVWEPTHPSFGGCFAVWIQATYAGVPNRVVTKPTVILDGRELEPRVRYAAGWNVGLDPAKHFVIYA